jgi:hypothetical protein
MGGVELPTSFLVDTKFQKLRNFRRGNSLNQSKYFPAMLNLFHHSLHSLPIFDNNFSVCQEMIEEYRSQLSDCQTTPVSRKVH